MVPYPTGVFGGRPNQVVCAHSKLKHPRTVVIIHLHFLLTDGVLAQNEAVSTDDPIRHTFWQDLEYPEEEIVTELIYSLAFTPPMRCDESVKDYCRIRWSKIPNFHELPEWKNKKGQSFRQICYEIRMITDGVSLDFQIFHNRTMVASKNVAVDFHGGGVSNRREVD